jgi:CRISPR-associated endonuclease/helicase Cas3
LQWPDQPSVVVSTVDQFGSRLLFRGYGVSPGMWPVHAGLTGNDCLVILDEVHLSTAFAELLADLEQLTTVRAVPRRVQVVQMSATPVGEARTRFSLTAEEIGRSPELARRMNAPKLATLRHIGSKRQRPEEAWEANISALLGEFPDNALVGVIVNRVASARAIAAVLRRSETKRPVMLLTGRMRGLERTKVEAAALAHADPDHGSPAVVVATQCIEVGADLSFDAMVTEVSALASLRQRFGRLDRRGRLASQGTPARALVVGVESSLEAPVDPVYGVAMSTTWHCLTRRFGDQEFDVGPTARSFDDLALLIDDGTPASLDVEPTHPAVIMPSHLELLSFTRPAPACSPEVAPFLHGLVPTDPDVSVLWREDIDVEDVLAADAIEASLEVLPPTDLEIITVPLSAARRWLRRQSPGIVADVDAHTDDDPLGGNERWAWRWRPGEEVERVAPGDLRAGDVLVVPCSYGGLVDGVWAPESDAAVADCAEEVAALARRYVVRVQSNGSVEEEVDLAALWTVAEERMAQRNWPDEVRAALRASSPVEYRPGWFALIHDEQPVAARLDGSDLANSWTGRRIPLRTHLEGVGELAEHFGRSCGLPPTVTADLRLAGELHDLGKLDPRFQVWLHGDEIAAAMAEEPLAKGVVRPRRGWTGGYPRGARHEYLSAELAASSTALLQQAHDPDLVLHLVTSHHGYGRPLPTPVPDPAPTTVVASARGQQLEASTELPSASLGADALRRFAAVTRRYGCHGVAWLEAIFRLADHRRSEEEVQRWPST